MYRHPTDRYPRPHPASSASPDRRAQSTFVRPTPRRSVHESDGGLPTPSGFGSNVPRDFPHQHSIFADADRQYDSALPNIRHNRQTMVLTRSNKFTSDEEEESPDARARVTRTASFAVGETARERRRSIADRTKAIVEADEQQERKLQRKESLTRKPSFVRRKSFRRKSSGRDLL
eukprot:CAMPEP_0197864782 /NCGR_PEP_ID=MMETSP1438-20131217/43286_1 /TAXON_ID=1461541 /ORGANISM="Pterosperma sp., Strain CCMP1384" /LENGTH=174 /DNA_ID=CAMNT_0043483153 /DNA_START=38 /DNA_END=558 /DNA_ORIENTATION=-